jgi:hypothetical protein
LKFLKTKFQIFNKQFGKQTALATFALFNALLTFEAGEIV